MDNARGPLLPVFRELLRLTHSQTSALLVGGYIISVFCSGSFMPLMNRYGEQAVAIATAIFALFACIYAFYVSSFSTFVVFGVLLGGVVSGFGACANVLILQAVPASKQARLLCALHAMYGFGSLAAPLVVSGILVWGWSWPWTLAIIPPVGTAITLYYLIRAHGFGEVPARTVQSKKLSLFQCVLLLTMGGYVGGEVTLSMWLPTYLVETAGMSVSQASPYASGFFLAMALSRMVCLFTLRNEWEWPLLAFSLVMAFLGFFAGRAGYPLGFAAAGLMGPFFPIFMARLARNFPNQWRSLTLWILVAMQITLALCHFSIGRLTDAVGISKAYWLPVLFFAVASSGLLAFYRWERKSLAPL
ncbi:MAG: MFS transporter [Bdellovibrionaceae bacterium]|nr:MFS transporter [Pseudobdellovibrionaceae bacterium]